MRICDSIIWLRRDLRLYDHTSFASAINNGGKILPIFIFDEEILARFKDKNDRRLTFIANALTYLNEQLKKFNGEILILYGKGSEIAAKIAVILGAKKIFAARDYEPETIQRDKKINELAKQNNIEFILEEDHILVPIDSVKKSDNSPYKVFTPYKNAWKNIISPMDYSERHVKFHNDMFDDINKVKIVLNKENIKFIEAKDPENILKEIGYNYVDLPKYLDIDDGQKRLKSFVRNKMSDYKTNRNFMALDGTIRLSAYIRFGLVSIRECYREADRENGSEAWINELIWRDFYLMILYNFPSSSKTELQEQYRNKINWQNNKESFDAWKEGRTGFPLVDAAMRQLTSTGWMHNRLRMITASFMCKQLLLDWRKGEEFFAEYLMDYDLAANVGGWQWCSSTGTDAQPYFRIFNPTLQGKAYDEQGEFVRKFLPELKDVPNKYIFEPKKYDKNLNYPDPVIDNKIARDKAIKAFKQAKGKNDAEY